MSNVISTNFRGATITIAITGLPILITGEVIGGNTDVVGLRLAGGNKVYIKGDLIAFFY